jgi:hypothetical protein
MVEVFAYKSIVTDLPNSLEIHPLTLDDHEKAGSIAMLSREKNPSAYVEKLIHVNGALQPSDTLDLDTVQRTRKKLHERFEMDDETFNRRVRFLQKGYKLAFPQSNFSPLNFTKQNISFTEYSYFSRQRIEALTYDWGIRLILLDLLAQGYRSDGLKQLALTSWQEKNNNIIHLLYEYKTVEQYCAVKHHGYNTVVSRLNELYPHRRETFPIKQAHNSQAVLLSPLVIESLDNSMRVSRRHAASAKSASPTDKIALSPKNHIEIGVTYITKKGYTLTPENILRVQKHLHKKMKIDYPIQTIAAMFAIARKKNIHAIPSHSQYVSAPAQPHPVEYKSK